MHTIPYITLDRNFVNAADMLTAFLVCALAIGAQAVSYADVGKCKDDVVADYDNNLDALPLAAYVHAVTRMPQYESVDGIVVTLTNPFGNPSDSPDDPTDPPSDPTEAPSDPSDDPEDPPSDDPEDPPSDSTDAPTTDNPNDSTTDDPEDPTDDPGLDDGIIATATYHKVDGTLYAVNYTNTPVTNFALQEAYVQPNGEILYFVVYNLGLIPECNAAVLYRCSFEGTNPLDVLNVIKMENKPLSDECEAKIAQTYTNKGIVPSPLIKFPYKLNNYS